MIGATGAIGSQLVAEALHRGHDVTAVVRDRSKVAAGERPAVAQADVLDPGQVAAVARGQDVLISAVGGGADGAANEATIRPAAESLVAAMRSLGAAAPLLITIGGAGSLTAPDGNKVWDAEGLPDFLLRIMHAHGDALDFLREIEDVRWVYVSPAALIEPGARTGEFRIADDDLIIDASGESEISIEDFAVAVINEAEDPQHVGARFTVAY